MPAERLNLRSLCRKGEGQAQGRLLKLCCAFGQRSRWPMASSTSAAKQRAKACSMLNCRMGMLLCILKERMPADKGPFFQWLHTALQQLGHFARTRDPKVVVVQQTLGNTMQEYAYEEGLQHSALAAAPLTSALLPRALQHCPLRHSTPAVGCAWLLS